MWIVGLLSVSFFLHVLAVDRRLHERLCCHAAPFIDNNGIHGWFIAWGHEYFFLSITRIIFLSRIFEFSNFVFTRSIADSHGFSFFFFSCPELSNYRIFVFTRNIADSHGFSFFSFLVPNFRILSFCPETCLLSRIIEFLSSVTFRDTPCDYKKIRKFSNSWQERLFRDLPWFSVWL